MAHQPKKSKVIRLTIIAGIVYQKKFASFLGIDDPDKLLRPGVDVIPMVSQFPAVSAHEARRAVLQHYISNGCQVKYVEVKNDLGGESNLEGAL